MALLERLSIRGIRSFSPDGEEQVKFSGPLTLFLGQNGCGKTTIIESLKFALTGDIPGGTSSGSGFVNDPKLSSKNSTKGCVKVRFVDNKGDKITVAKFVEVQCKNNKLQFKNLAPTVRWEGPDGAHEDITGRCADIDAYCIQKLNVSKAILNNVIFCHQENAAWPLEEGKKLKEKFDEIFGAKEYNEIVDKLRKDIKDRSFMLKLTKEQLSLRSEIKKNVEKLKDNLGLQEELLEAKKEEIEKKSKDLEPLEKRFDEILEVENVLGNLQTKLTGLQKTYEGMIHHQESIKKHLDKEFEGTDEDLKRAIDSFKDRQRTIERDILEKEEKRELIEGKIVSFSKELQNKQVRFGQLKAEEELYQKKCEDRNHLVEKAKIKCNVEGDTVIQVLENLTKHVANIEKEFDRMISNKGSEEKKLQQVIDNTRAKHASAQSNLDTKTKTIKEVTATISQIKIKLRQLEISSSRIKENDQRINEMRQKLRKRIADFDEMARMQELDELKEEIQRKEQVLNKLEREQRVLQQNFISEENIRRENSAISGFQNEIEDIKRRHMANFSQLFKNQLPEERFEEAVKTIMTTEDEKYKNLTKSISDQEKNLSSLDASVKHLDENLEQYRAELQLNQAKVTSVSKGNDFEGVLEESYRKKEKLQKDKGTYRSCKIMYEAFIKQFEANQPCCPVCDTNFSNQRNKVATIVNKLKSRIEEVPTKLSILERELEQEEEFYNKLQQLKPISDRIQLFKDDQIPSIQRELQQTKERRDETSMELAMLKSELLEPQNMLEICRKVISDAALLDRLLADTEKSRSTVETLKNGLVKVPSNRTLEETENELTKMKADMSNSRKQLDTQKDVFDQTKEVIQRLNSNLQREIQVQLESQKQLQEQPLLEKQMKELAERSAKLKQEIESCTESVGTLSVELMEQEQQRDTLVMKNKKDLDTKRSEVDIQKRILEDIEKIHASITAFETSEAQDKLSTVVEEIDSLSGKINKLEETRDILKNYVNDKKQELASQESKLRALNDNTELREYRTKSGDIKVEIQDLKKQIGGHNYRSIHDEKIRIEQSISSITRDIDIRKGECKQVKQLIENLQKDLNQRENKMAHKEYMSKYYELKAKELAIDDLKVYTVNLERAILMFHKERMVQINKTIRELWRNIYKGNDIDYIEIQTEDSVGGSGANRRRIYNYKVVEVKKGVELEMRGRCSAGQRVLACLIIRMALADTFSGSCGILALDEPTTNLDRDNIASLSDALARLITDRENQKSFQLLIITHDEEFLTTLTRSQSVSSYYRVQRNRDGFSEIVRQTL